MQARTRFEGRINIKFMAFGLFKKNEKKEDAHSGPRYYDLKVKDIVHETRETVALILEHPPGGKIEYKAGQFLTLLATIEGKEVTRAYSLCSSPFVDTDLAVTVKRLANGLMSNWLPDHLKTGQTLQVMDPIDQFTSRCNRHRKRHMLMF